MVQTKKKPVGWKGESARHSAAARGIKTVIKRTIALHNLGMSDEMILKVEAAPTFGKRVEKELLARGIIIEEPAELYQWPKTRLIDGEEYHISSVWETQRVAEMSVKEVLVGKVYDKWGRRGELTGARVVFHGAYKRAKPKYLRNVGGYEEGNWAVYQRR